MSLNNENHTLWEAYSSTRYRGEPEGEEPWVVRIGETSPRPGPMAYITADNPRSEPLSRRENRRRRRRLRTELRDAGHDLLPGRSIDASDGETWPDEVGFWLLSIERQEAVEIARRWAQNAIVFVDAERQPHLVWCQN